MICVYLCGKAKDTANYFIALYFYAGEKLFFFNLQIDAPRSICQLKGHSLVIWKATEPNIS